MKMNKSYAVSILGIEGEITSETVEKAYRRACMKYHPDRNPAGLEMMKAVNLAYAALKDLGDETIERTVNSDYGERLNAALNAIINFNLNIDIMGAWIWVSGNTKPYKEELKAAGFRWAPKKKHWTFRAEEHRSSSRGTASLEEIEARYGKQTVKTAKSPTMLTA